MNNVKQFLSSHPLIVISLLEQECNIPQGTIRVNGNRKIPEKYIESLEAALIKYGYGNNKVIEPNIEKTIEVIKTEVIPVLSLQYKQLKYKDKKVFVKQGQLYYNDGLNKRIIDLDIDIGKLFV